MWSSLYNAHSLCVYVCLCVNVISRMFGRISMRSALMPDWTRRQINSDFSSCDSSGFFIMFSCFCLFVCPLFFLYTCTHRVLFYNLLSPPRRLYFHLFLLVCLFVNHVTRTLMDTLQKSHLVS